LAAGISRTRLIATAAAFSALYALFRLVPVSLLIGAPGFIPLSNSLALAYALLLGPFAAPVSVVVGTIVGYSLGNPPIFLGLDFITPLTSVVAMGLMLRRKHLRLLTMAFAALLVVFNLSPMTTPMILIPGTASTFPLTWLHFVAIAVLAAYASLPGLRPSASAGIGRLALTLGSVAFVGLMLQQLVGSLAMFEGILGYVEGSIPPTGWPGIWEAAFFEYPIEWIGQTLLSVAIALPVYRLVSRRVVPSRPVGSYGNS
jgi:hypothetical protein